MIKPKLCQSAKDAGPEMNCGGLICSMASSSDDVAANTDGDEAAAAAAVGVVGPQMAKAL